MGAPAVSLEAATEAFVAERQQLLGIARRVLGRTGEAEDVVQDAWLRWQRYDRSVVENPGAFLVTTTTRLALNVTQTARVRHAAGPDHRETEPVDRGADPTEQAERYDALERASTLVLDAMTPPERAAFVLREGFGYPYDRIARVVGSSEVNARQLVSRARRRALAPRPAAARPTPAGRQRRHFLDAFRAASEHGDLARLEAVLAEDVARRRSHPPAAVVRLDPVERRARRRAAVTAREPEQGERMGA